MIVFRDGEADCIWLRETHLVGPTCAGVPLFKSYCIFGNDDSPEWVHLYGSTDPTTTDPCTRVEFFQYAAPKITLLCQELQA